MKRLGITTFFTLLYLLCAVGAKAQTASSCDLGTTHSGDITCTSPIFMSAPPLISTATISSITNSSGTSTMNCNISNCGLSGGQGFYLGGALPIACQGYHTITGTSGDTASFASTSCSGPGMYTNSIGNVTPAMFFQNPLVRPSNSYSTLSTDYDGGVILEMVSSGNPLDAMFLDATGQVNFNQPGLQTSGLYAGIGIDVGGNLEIGSEQNMINGGCPGLTPNTIFQGPYTAGSGTFVGGLTCYHGLAAANNLANGFDYQLYGNKCGTYSSPCSLSSTTTTLYVTPSSGYGSSCTSTPVCGSFLVKVWGGLVNAAAGGTIGMTVNCPLNGSTPATGVTVIPASTAFAAAGTHVYGEAGLQCDSGSNISLTVTGSTSIANNWIFDGKVYLN